MSTSDTNRPALRPALIWLASSLGCGLFTLVYNRFGHGVHSLFMDWLFLCPLPGAVFHGLFYICKKRPGRAAANLLAAGLATLTAGSLFKGILEIAGTSSPYEAAFFVIGGLLVLAGSGLQIWAGTTSHPS